MRQSGHDVALAQLLPNAMTLGAICAGATAIRMAALDRFDLAVALLGVAVLLDGLDGRLARALKSESLVGAELDSLADVVNFGVAPAIILYFFTLWQDPVTGWGAALIYIVCCTWRLARFNATAKTGAHTDRRFFTGVPSPAGALLALAPVFLTQALPQAALPPLASALWLVACGLLMASRIPTFSLKMRIPGHHARLVLVAVALSIAALALWPWHVLLAFDLLYLAAVAVAGYVYAYARKD